MEPTPSTFSAVPTQDSLYTTGLVQEQHDALDAQPPLTPVERIVDTFIAPTKTFADIRRNRSWWPAFLLLAVVGYIFTFSILQHVGIHTVYDNIIKSNPAQAEKMAAQPADQQATSRKIGESFTQGIFYVAPLLTLLFNAVTALLLWVGFNFLLGGKATYGGMYAVGMFAWLPSILKSLLTVVMVFAGDAETFNINDPVGTNPGFYLGPESAHWLKSLLGSFDLFTLWTLILLGLGGAIVARVKTTSGYILVFGAFAVVVLIKTGFAAFTS